MVTLSACFQRTLLDDLQLFRVLSQLGALLVLGGLLGDPLGHEDGDALGPEEGAALTDGAALGAEDGPAEGAALTDGTATTSNNFVRTATIIHGFAVNPNFEGRGYTHVHVNLNVVKNR